MATSKSAWAGFERRVAKDFEAVRVGAMHPNEQRESCDCISDVHFIECKLRAVWPSPAEVNTWFTKLQFRNLHSGNSRVPLLCVKHKSQRGYWIVREIPNESGLFWQHSSEYFSAAE